MPCCEGPAQYNDRLRGEQRREKFGTGPWVPGKPAPALLDDNPDWESKLKFDNGLFKTRRGIELFWSTITPADPSKIERVIVYFHGLFDNSAWFTQNSMLVHALKTNSATISFDIAGHGRSDGLYLYMESWEQNVNEAVEFVEGFALQQRDKWSAGIPGRPDLKVFGFGESMGGGLLTTICIRHPTLLDGAILMAPMVFIADDVKPPWIVQKVFRHCVHPVAPRATIAPVDDIAPLCARNAAVVEALQKNPLGGGGVKLRTGLALALLLCTEWLGPRLGQMRTPFLVLHGGDDKVTSPQYSKKLHAEAEAADKTIHVYEGAWHVEPLHGGPEQRTLMDKVLGDISAWLSARSGPAPPSGGGAQQQQQQQRAVGGGVGGFPQAGPGQVPGMPYPAVGGVPMQMAMGQGGPGVAQPYMYPV